MDAHHELLGFFRHPGISNWRPSTRSGLRIDEAKRALVRRRRDRRGALLAGDVSDRGFRRDDPPVTLLATDIDEAALLFARRGEYGELSSRPFRLDFARAF